MGFEWLIGTRYLGATRRRGAPSAITITSVAAVAIGVFLLIPVLAILNGFEGDLRDKILGTKAHLLITGDSVHVLPEYEHTLAVVQGTEGVIGASAFIESDVMIASATNYSGVVVRGIDPETVVLSSDLDTYMVEGELGWLADPQLALQHQLGEANAQFGNRSELDALEARAAELREALERENAEMEDSRARLEAVIREQMADIEGSADAPSAEADGSGPTDGSGEGSADAADASPRRVGPPSLEERMEERRVGPPSLEERMEERRVGPPPLAERDSGVGPPGLAPPTGRTLPGILIGTELRDSLHVDLGSQLQLINPDGDMGPTGPMPRAWPFRVAGVFHTGLYEYDNTMVYVLLPTAARFLNVEPGAASGIEVRVANMDRTEPVAAGLETALAAASVSNVSVATWVELNRQLFSALALEQLVIGLLLMIVVLVASFAIVCVLIMIVIQRSDEIAILRSMGATRGDVQRIFFVQGMSIGVSGTAIGVAIGLGLIAVLVYVGIPLDPNVYYIDRVPVESSWLEVLAIVAGALAISAVATLFPSLQAARLDPAAALRHE